MLVRQHLSQDLGSRIGGGALEDTAVACLSFDVNQSIECRFLGMPRLDGGARSQAVSIDVLRNPVEPGFEAGLSPEGAKTFVNLQKGVLREVSTFVRGKTSAREETTDATKIEHEELAKSVVTVAAIPLLPRRSQTISRSLARNGRWQR